MSPPFYQEGHKNSDFTYYKEYRDKVMKPYLDVIDDKNLVKIESNQFNKKGSYRNVTPLLLQETIDEVKVQTNSGEYTRNYNEAGFALEVEKLLSMMANQATGNSKKRNFIDFKKTIDYLQSLKSSTSRGSTLTQGGKEVDVLLFETFADVEFYNNEMLNYNAEADPKGERHPNKQFKYTIMTDDVIQNYLLPLGPYHPINMKFLPASLFVTGTRIQDTG